MSTSADGLAGRPPPRQPSSPSSSATALPPPSRDSIATWDYFFGPSAPLPPLQLPPLSRVSSSSSSSSSYFSSEILPPPPPPPHPPPPLILRPLRSVPSPPSSSSSAFSAELLPPPPPPPLLTIESLLRGASPSSSPSFSTEVLMPPPPPPPPPPLILPPRLLLRVPSPPSSSFLTELLPPPPPPPPPLPFSLSPDSATWEWDDYIQDAPEQPPSRLLHRSLGHISFGISPDTSPPLPPHASELQTSPPRSPPDYMPTHASSEAYGRRRGESSSQAASSGPVAALATVTVSDAAEVCAVCTDALPLASTASGLPCGHLYHYHCIVPWLSLRNSCPVCRRGIPMFPAAAASTTGETVPSPPHDYDDPQPTTATDRRRSLPGARRIRRICRRLLNYMELSRSRSAAS
ncbi:formin-like protein 3 [Oryza brachyantha]|uniref:formin-like protein 3 n=1 Tax=Oryza brachyantha TaxID=4533 RepID=UPI001ADB04C5|nr:formin-like protein 3 [Oryza brachyantha]